MILLNTLTKRDYVAYYILSIKAGKTLRAALSCSEKRKGDHTNNAICALKAHNANAIVALESQRCSDPATRHSNTKQRVSTLGKKSDLSRKMKHTKRLNNGISLSVHKKNYHNNKCQHADKKNYYTDSNNTETSCKKVLIKGLNSATRKASAQTRKGGSS